MNSTVQKNYFWPFLGQLGDSQFSTAVGSQGTQARKGYSNKGVLEEIKGGKLELLEKKKLKNKDDLGSTESRLIRRVGRLKSKFRQVYGNILRKNLNLLSLAVGRGI
ncbi:uncharacterized protein LOC109725338 [Ananas comosus]|uniref:Uncharacterized protein LOC109725338 n=1 Tax=Ananas comosus TaxID=4615 RepID=A0A6P5GQK8_ANACO|nr:uncharacterized protein LOC109725338 [Ananas comosus]